MLALRAARGRGKCRKAPLSLAACGACPASLVTVGRFGFTALRAPSLGSGPWLLVYSVQLAGLRTPRVSAFATGIRLIGARGPLLLTRQDLQQHISRAAVLDRDGLRPTGFQFCAGRPLEQDGWRRGGHVEFPTIRRVLRHDGSVYVYVKERGIRRNRGQL